MKKIWQFSFICLLLMLTLIINAKENKKIYFASLDWPPYIGENLDEMGANTIVAKKAFAAMGYELIIEFYPWARAVDLAKTNQKYSGYFPEYYAKEIEVDFIFSDPIGNSPLGFVENIDSPFSWNNLNDLKPILIGTVRGYVNTEEFDKMVANKKLNVDEANDDLTNLKKVGNKRLQLAVIDQYVLEYLLETDSSLAQIKTKLQFNKKLLENKKLYLCFRRNDEGEKLVKIFNEGLKKINIDKINNDYFKTH